MPHGFVREMLSADRNHFRLTLCACLFGGLLLGVSYLALLMFDQVELSAMVSLTAALLLGSPLVYNELKDLWLNRLDTLIFDKTGTLTTGRLTVSSLSVNGKVSEEKLIELTASLEQYSNHPVAKAVMTEARSRSITPSDAVDAVETPGFGILGNLNGNTIAIGRRLWISERCPGCAIQAMVN
jgi:hypothetical protein